MCGDRNGVDGWSTGNSASKSLSDSYELVWVKAVVEEVFVALKEDVEQSKAVVVNVVVLAVYYHFVLMGGIIATLVTKEEVYVRCCDRPNIARSLFRLSFPNHLIVL